MTSTVGVAYINIHLPLFILLGLSQTKIQSSIENNLTQILSLCVKTFHLNFILWIKQLFNDKTLVHLSSIHVKSCEVTTLAKNIHQGKLNQ